jgi:hypothetical protein
MSFGQELAFPLLVHFCPSSFFAMEFSNLCQKSFEKQYWDLVVGSSRLMEFFEGFFKTWGILIDC